MLSINYDSEIEEDEKEEEKKLDINWIEEFEKVDKDYESFYKEDLLYVKIIIIYINNNNEIDKLKEEKVLIKNNIISREAIIGILKKNHIKDDKKYTIMSMLKYNIDLEPIDIRNFLLDETYEETIDIGMENNNDDSFLSIVKNVDEINWNKTISMFQDLNNLFIIFYENPKVKENTHKISNSNRYGPNKGSSSSKTKRIYFGYNGTAIRSHNKTIRKYT